MSDHEERRDPGEFYPGGKVWKVPGHSSGGGTIDLDDTVTETGVNGVKSKGIWSWVKSLLPNWLTANYDEPATVASVNQKYTKPNGGIPRTDLEADVNTSLDKADTASQPGHTHTQSQVTGLDDALASKRGKDDLAVYPKAWITKGLPEGVTVTQGPLFVLGTSWIMTTSDGGQWEVVGAEDDTHIDAWTDYMGKGYSPVCDLEMLAKTSQLSDKLDSSDVVAPSPDAAQGKAADAKATGDALKDKADEFTQWVVGDYEGDFPPSSGQPDYDSTRGVKPWRWYVCDFAYWQAEGNSDSVELQFEGGEAVSGFFTATRKRVLRTGEALAPGLDDDGVPSDANVRDLFSKSNTLFKRGVRYAHSIFAFGSGEKLKDRAINALTFTASSASHTFDLAAALPTATDGFVRDFLVRLVSDAKVTFETGMMDIRGDGLAMEDGAADMLITLTEIASGVWYVRSIDITAQTEA